MNDMLGRILRLLNKDVNETFDQTTDSLEAIRDFLTAIGTGLSFYGEVTAVPGANQFTCDALIGLGDDKFLDLAGIPFHVFVLYDAGGAAAAPQGESRPVTDYVSATGTFTTYAFSAAVAVGDQVLIIHPLLAANLAVNSGSDWFVNATIGSDNYDGQSKRNAFETIGAAVAVAATGDTIHIARGTYDEAVSIPAGLVGLKVICEPGVYLSNTTPGTVVAIAAPYAYWEGGVIAQAGQIGFQVTDEWVIGKGIRVYGCTVGFDMDGEHPLMVDCKAYECTTTGFDISEDSGVYIDCLSPGAAASRGFYLSHTNAHYNILVRCSTLGCTAGGYECVAGADENMFDHCSQSVLCAGPTDAGANNTWANHTIGSIVHNITEAVGPYSYLDAGGEQTVYENTGATRRRISFSMDLNTMTQNGTIRLYRKVDGANYRIWIEELFNAGGTVKAFTRSEIFINQDFKVTYQESADEGAARSIPYNVIIKSEE